MAYIFVDLKVTKCSRDVVNAETKNGAVSSSFHFSPHACWTAGIIIFALDGEYISTLNNH